LPISDKRVVQRLFTLRQKLIEKREQLRMWNRAWRKDC